MTRHEGTNENRSQAYRSTEDSRWGFALVALVVAAVIVFAVAETTDKPEWVKEAEAAGAARNRITANGAGDFEGVFRKLGLTD